MAPGGRAGGREARELWGDVAIIAGLALARPLAVAALGRAFVGADLGELFLPAYSWWWARPRLLGGWNPWVFGGFEAHADPLLGRWHPFGLVYAVVDPVTAIGVETALTALVGGVGMAWYLARLRCPRAARLIGAALFVHLGFLATHVVHPPVTRTAMVIPFGLLAAMPASAARPWRGLALALAGVVLGGHPQTIAYAIGLVGLHWLVVAPGPWRARAGSLAAALACAAALSAPVWGPAIGLVARSVHAEGAPVAMSEMPGPQPARWGDLVVPFPTGDQLGRLTRDWNRRCGTIECGGYPGGVALVLVLAGLGVLLRSSVGRFWLVAALVGAILATGVLGPLLPGPVRAPSRWLLWWSVALAALAAIVTSQCAQIRGRRPWLLAGAGLLALLAANHRPHAWPGIAQGAGAVVVVATVGVVVAGRRRIAALVAAALVDALVFAVLVPGSEPAGQAVRLDEGIASLARRVREQPAARSTDRVLGVPVVPGAAWASNHRLPLVQGFDVLAPQRIAALLAPGAAPRLVEVGVVSNPRLFAPTNHALDVLRIRWVELPAGPEIARVLTAGHVREGVRWRRAARTSSRELWENRRARPVAWLVAEARQAERSAALALVRGDSGGFDPGREAIVDRSPGPLDAPVAAPGTARVVAYGEDAMRLDVRAAGRALVVTSEPWSPGWRALVDDRPAEMLVANGTFRGVVVPAGRHVVRFVYRPSLLAPWGLLAITGLLALGGSWRRDRRGDVD